MTHDIGNYAAHARYWDWGGNDRSAEFERWRQYAERYGKRVLIPMCAWGDAGAYLAERGFTVTAFDITPEMIAEGRARYGNLPGLTLLEGDVTDFRIDAEPFDFSYCVDFGHIHTLERITAALRCINRHLRVGGALVIEVGLPPQKSLTTPLETFRPFRQVYADLTVWKTGITHIDAETARTYISQTFYAEHSDSTPESFDHEFYLQSYSRDEWQSALSASGFELVSETPDGGHWLGEAVKI